MGNPDGVNLILNTYRCFFFKLLLRIFYVVRQLRPRQERRVSKVAWKWKASKFVSSKFASHNRTKMVDVWNVNKLTEANEVGADVKKTNTDFAISIWNMEYVTCLS